MSKLSKNFKRSEFSCKCGCGFATVDAELLRVLEEIRAHFRAPVHVHSGCRCQNRNVQVGGSPKSKHLSGIAADISVRGVSPSTVHRHLLKKYSGKYGIGKYSTFCHIDVRSSVGRW